jgi:P-type Ca2+ transporter type 2C
MSGANDSPVPWGLTEDEAALRLRQEGPNELPSAKPRSILAIAVDVVREPMFLLLVACGGLYLLLGDVQEALMLLGFVVVVIGITLRQERKAERALEALRDLSSPRALVIREGQPRRIAGREVVRGDIAILSEGDRVPADAVVLECTNLSADESLLTGESVPVRKMASRGSTSIERPGGDDLPFVYSGSLIVQGRGIAEVLRIGIETEIGKIGRALRTLEPEETRLQQETGALVRKLAIAGLAVCLIVVLVYGFTRSDWTHGVLAGITLAMALLPEEFPVVLTIFLALGAWRISRNNVLTRRVPAVETLGSATVLCVDKTGTLTLNQMTVRTLCAGGEFHDLRDGESLPEAFHELVEFSLLASHRDPFDPMEKAIKALGDYHLSDTEHIHEDWRLVRAYPLSPELLALSHVWQSPDGRDFVIATKGAPEAVVELCHLDQAAAARVGDLVGSMARRGLRVLGIARSMFSMDTLPPVQHDFEFRFVGLVGFADPVRPSVPGSVEECYTAGMRVVMITGDYPATAQSIGLEIGLRNVDEVITGSELDAMSDAELQHRIRTTNIFARAVPEQKLRLVRALKANGEVVAMTGDGVNDAPALKAAEIGIAMGGRGTDVARESAALVLLDDNFSSIVQAVKVGRRIFDNLQKAIAYIFAIHVPIAGMSLLPVLLGWPLVLLPVHIAFLELIIDPACSVVFEAEPEEPDVMRRRPRNSNQPLFSRRMVSLSVLQGLAVLLVTAAVFAWAFYQRRGADEARALAFTTLIFANVGLIFINRSWSKASVSTFRNPNRALWWVTTGAFAVLMMVVYIPHARSLFHFAPLHLKDLLFCFGAGVVSVLWFEFFKYSQTRPARSRR